MDSELAAASKVATRLCKVPFFKVFIVVKVLILLAAAILVVKLLESSLSTAPSLKEER